MAIILAPRPCLTPVPFSYGALDARSFCVAATAALVFNPFDDGRNTHTAGRAHRYQTPLPAPTMQQLGQDRHDSRPCRRKRMPESY